MDKETLVISTIIVLCVLAAVAAYGITNSDNPVFSNLTNMGKNNAGHGAGNNTTALNGTGHNNSSSGNGTGTDGAGSGSSTSSSSSNSQNGGSSGGSGSGYSDWQEDYETGEFDADENPIYRTVSSTSGGENPAGIYETYWSAAGPISEERIG